VAQWHGGTCYTMRIKNNILRRVYRNRKPDAAALILRVVFAVLFFYAGWEKLQHVQAFVDSFAKLGFNSFEAYLVLWVELIGGVFLLIGFLHKPTCVAFAVMMAVAVWGLPPKAGELFWGHDYQFVILAAMLALYISGPGKYSLARLREKKHPLS
jgi:putative oxidoreductase